MLSQHGVAVVGALLTLHVLVDQGLARGQPLGSLAPGSPCCSRVLSLWAVFFRALLYPERMSPALSQDLQATLAGCP